MISTLKQASVVASQVSPPGCHPAICKNRAATTSAIMAMKAETCDDGPPPKPVTISSGTDYTVSHHDMTFSIPPGILPHLYTFGFVV